MNRVAVEIAGHSGLTNPPAPVSMGRFDPTDPASSDVLFLAEDAAVFARFEAALVADTGLADGRTASPYDDAAAPASTVTDPETNWSIAPCLMAGALLQTDKGEVAAQDLRPGQRILTRDKGFQTVLWVGYRQIAAQDMHADPGLRPVQIAAGALGPNLPSAPMQVPLSQRMLVEGPRTKLMFGAREVFVPAAHLLGYPGIAAAPIADVMAVQLLCAAHEVIWVDGVWTETHQAGAFTSMQTGTAQHAEIAELTPENAPQTAARRTLRRHEADLLLA